MKGLKLLACLLLVSAVAVRAQSIAYTVQVVAVSDQSQAFSLIRELGVDGYPAYATRAQTDQGDVVRVRIGGFANRAAALLYAETMPDFPADGGRPLPALADNIPQGVMPFEPRLLLSEDLPGFTLLDWDGHIAVELPAGEADSRTYRVIRDGMTVEFSAWLAWPDDEGMVLRYRDEPLWPEGWQGLDGELLQQEMNTRLNFIAGRLGVSESQLRTGVRDRAGLPVLVVLERFSPWVSLEVGQLLGASGPAADGEPHWAGPLLGEASPEPQRSVLLQASADLPVADLQTDNWTVTFDDPFMLQSLPGSTRSWRAAVGAPLWTDGTHLLARHAGSLLLYDFVDRR